MPLQVFNPRRPRFLGVIKNPKVSGTFIILNTHILCRVTLLPSTQHAPHTRTLIARPYMNE